jgi:hypothetical protein
MQNPAGGMEATEVTSLPCGVDTAKDDDIIASSRSSLHNQVYTDSVSGGDLKVE